MFARAATLWLLIAVSVAAAQEPNTPVPPKAMDAIQAGKWDEALRLLEPAIKAGNPDAHYCAGLDIQNCRQRDALQFRHR